MDDVLSRNIEDLRDDEKAKRYFQLQNRYLFQRPIITSLTSSAQESTTTTAAFSTPPNPFNVTPDLKQAAIL